MKCLKANDFKYICIDQDYSHYIETQPIKKAGNYMVYDRNISLPQEFRYSVSIVLSTECMLQNFENEEPREKIDRYIYEHVEAEPIGDEELV